MTYFGEDYKDLQLCIYDQPDDKNGNRIHMIALYRGAVYDPNDEDRAYYPVMIPFVFDDDTFIRERGYPINEKMNRPFMMHPRYIKNVDLEEVVEYLI